MILIKVVKLVVGINWLLRILCNRESPCALFGYSLILDVRKLIISHVRWDTCMIIPINNLNNLRV